MAARAGIGNQLRLIELLGNGECLFRRESVFGVRLFLQGRQIIQKWGFLHGFLAFHMGDGNLTALFGYAVGGFGRLFLFPLFYGREFHDLTVRRSVGR